MIEEVVKEVIPGEVYVGKVTKVEDFGCFVELWSGCEGLCHVSKLAWERVEKASDMFKVGDEIMVFFVFGDCEMSIIQLFAGVDHRLHTILVLHEFQEFVNPFHVQLIAVYGFDVKDRHQVLFRLANGLLEIGKLLIGSSATTIDMVASDKQSSLTSLFHVIFVHPVGNAGAFSCLDIDKLYACVFCNPGPVDAVLIARNIDPFLGIGHRRKSRQNNKKV